MAMGSLQSVVVCVPVVEPTIPQQQAVCPVIEGQHFATGSIQAYLVDPSQKNNFEAAVGQFDYAYASGLWTMAFSMVVGLYFVSSSIGAVLGMIRRG